MRLTFKEFYKRMIESEEPDETKIRRVLKNILVYISNPRSGQQKDKGSLCFSFTSFVS